MRTGFLFLTAFLLSVSTAFAQLGWYQLRQEGFDILYSIDMFDAENITAVGSDGLILRSTDGGASWTRPTSGATDNIRRIRWFSPSLGVILGNGGFAAKSVDGGATWQAIFTGVSDALLDIHFFDENVWMVIGRAELVLTTTDAGGSWTTMSTGTDNLNEIEVKGDFGVIVGNKGLLRVTSDGGKSWRERDSKTNLELTSVSIGDDSTAVAVGANGTIIRTQNGGRTWTAISASVPISSYRLSRVRHLTRERVVLSGYTGLVLWSTDSGLTWLGQESNTPANLESMAFIDSKIGVAAGWDGTIIRTNTGGTLDVRRVSAAQASALGIGEVWPNPLHRAAQAHVTMQLPSTGTATLRVYDMLGRERLRLFSDHADAGSYTVSWDAASLPKGVYLYRLEQNGSSQVRKFTLMD